MCFAKLLGAGFIAYSSFGKIYDCFASGNVYSTSNAYPTMGAFVGSALNLGRFDDTYIARCYSTGSVHWADTVIQNAGFMGAMTTYDINQETLLLNNYWDSEKSGANTSPCNAIAINTSSMKNSLSFQNWDFTHVWMIDENVNNGYPFYNPSLVWQPLEYESNIIPFAIKPQGSGTESDPYIISSLNELYWLSDTTADATFAHKLSAHYKQIVTIDAQETLNWWYKKGWSPVEAEFNGTYNGGGYAINNLYINRVISYAGLFGKIGSSGVVKNLSINAVINALSYSGIIAGQSAGIILNCRASGTCDAANYIGGIVGWNSGVISNCSADVKFNGTSNIGGISGFSNRYIYNSSAAGTISGVENTGGFVGNMQGGAINNCYTTASVYRKSGIKISIGAFIGFGYSENSFVENCYATGKVWFNNTLQTDKGFSGYSGNLILKHVYFDTEQSGASSSVCNAKPLTTLQMQDQNQMLGFNLTYPWKYDASKNDGLPILMQESEIRAETNGAGTEANPYLIAVPEDIIWLSFSPHVWQAHIAQQQDIDIPNSLYSDERNISYVPMVSFSGYFNGNNHTINNLKINWNHFAKTYYAEVGFLGRIEVDAKVKDLGLTNIAMITNNTRVGGLVGLNRGLVSRCYVTGNIYQIHDMTHIGGGGTGGFVGVNVGTITQSYADVYCAGSEQVRAIGGFVGVASSGLIEQCYALGNVDGGYEIGGFAGHSIGEYIFFSDIEATILNSYARGRVYSESNYGDNDIGVFVGKIRAKSKISNCYATGYTENKNSPYRNGFNGNIENPNDISVSVIHSFFDSDSAKTNLPAPDKGIPLSTQLMIKKTSYTDWDFQTIWSISDSINDGYPYFYWQIQEQDNGDIVNREPAISGNFDVIISISPNPCSQAISIASNKNVEGISIINSIGQKVLETRVNLNSPISVAMLKAGIYSVIVTFTDGEKKLLQLVKI